ncbi:MAG: hypothetical protein IID18_05055 [Nitrospinae bacterium]|nr:hypothetical protein [Nitrospinota bacterium]
MKTKNLFNLVPGIIAVLLLAVHPSPAYSGQDPSRLTARWTFHQDVAEKIEKHLARNTVAVGLSSSEQNILEKYGIRVGQSFITHVNDEVIRITRTDSGLRIEESVEPSVAEYRQQVPTLWNYALLRS